MKLNDCGCCGSDNIRIKIDISLYLNEPAMLVECQRCGKYVQKYFIDMNNFSRGWLREFAVKNWNAANKSEET